MCRHDSLFASHATAIPRTLLIEQHGGTIGMHSPGELGAGSTFFFTLPIISTIAPQLDLSLPPMAHSDVVVLLADRAEAADRLYPFLPAILILAETAPAG